jgi:hypothetical protein
MPTLGESQSPSSALKKERLCFSETSASIDESTRRQNPEELRKLFTQTLPTVLKATFEDELGRRLSRHCLTVSNTIRSCKPRHAYEFPSLFITSCFRNCNCVSHLIILQNFATYKLAMIRSASQHSVRDIELMD